MMTASASIAQLDRFLAAYGEDVVLMRVDDDNNVVAQVTCRARVDRAKKGLEAPAGIKPSGFDIILSPTPLLAAGWPDGDPANVVPVENAGDKVALDGRDEQRTVVWVDTKKLNNLVVRIDMRVSG